MTKHSKTILITLVTLTVAFAGCTSDDGGDGSMSEGEQGTDDGPVDLGNKGAISGLVVDDNFRPIQLKEDWGSSTPGEFQDQGFVLLLETAQRFETNENGEFKVLPLDPGSYTVRVAADNHEAIDQKVEVVAGEFAEVTLEARRQFSGGGTTLAQEEIIFIACATKANTPTGGYASVASIPYCNGDVSGDSNRAAFYVDYSGIAEDVRGMVTEMRAAQDGYYKSAVRSHDLSCSNYDSINGCVFTEDDVSNGRYVHSVQYPFKQVTGANSREYIEDGQDGYCSPVGLDDGSDSGCGRYFAPEFIAEVQTVLFTDTPTGYWQDEVGYYDVAGFTLSTGSAGVAFGIKAQFLQTVFLYELPESGIESFCALCEDADIPE